MREHVRAALIGLAVLVHGVAASPLPKAAKRSALQNEVAIDELNRWVGLLGAVGITTTREALAEGAYRTAQSLVGVRSTLMTPFRGWLRVTGTGQGWGLFTYPDTYPHQLVVYKRGEDQVWTPVYIALDHEYTWHRDVLAYRRIRGVYHGSTNKTAASYENFASWVARDVFAEFPDALQAKIGFVRFHTVRPGEPVDSERVEKHTRIIDRNAL